MAAKLTSVSKLALFKVLALTGSTEYSESFCRTSCGETSTKAAQWILPASNMSIEKRNPYITKT